MRKGKRRAARSAAPAKSTLSGVAIMDWGEVCPEGYVTLDRCPEIVTAVRYIAELIGAATIHLMSNEKDGDVRIINELSRAVDIDPSPYMTRATLMEAAVMNLYLYGDGNSIILPHTYGGVLKSLEVIAPSRVGIYTTSARDYRVQIDGITRDPESLLHFVLNPRRDAPFIGEGLRVSLKDIVGNLKQARTTEKAFLSSEYKPSIIVRVDGIVDEFRTPAGRQKLLKEYVKPATPGQPWVIPADQFQVEQIKPLSLADLAIKDTVELDRRLAAAIVGVPPFVVGVGAYNQVEYNAFIQTRIMTLAKKLAAEMTRKLLLNPKWFFRFNVWSLLDYDLQKVSSILLAGSDRGFVAGNEWRDRMNLPPAEGLNEYRVLENYIPIDMSGQQKKLNQEGEG